MTAEHVDVLIIGAGLSGIGAARALQDRHPQRSLLLLEARGAVGGTWDLFRYPGIRSDSDMYTLGYGFRPWVGDRHLADGPSILQYIRDTATDAGIDRRIRFHHRMVKASWSSADAKWTVEAERTDTGERVHLTTSFLYGCTGYYRDDGGYTPDFPGMDRFRGPVVHPQRWPEDLDHRGKIVVVIGSGATAVTLVPALARDAAHVVMLQRSPSYLLSLPGVDRLGQRLRELLPAPAAHALTRWRNVLLSVGIYQLSQRRPDMMKRALIDAVRKQLPPGFDVGTHFTPRYDPWDQRLCAVPDGDLFEALRDGRASVVTDTVASFTERGLRLGSGRELDADIIVTATGFTLQMSGGATLEVDGRPVRPPEHLTYKGMMLSDVPNMAFTVGYTNSSWTLKADLVADHVCRILAFMDQRRYDTCVPRNRDPSMTTAPLLDFGAGYVQRALAELPRQGDRWPWRLSMNYPVDLVRFRTGSVDDGVMEYRRAGSHPAPPGPPHPA